MTYTTALLRFKTAIAHWGPMQYLLLAAFWLAIAIPLYLAGWGVASLLGLPLMVLLITVSAWAASVWLKPKPPAPVKPRPGFPTELTHESLGVFPLSAYSDEEYARTLAWNGKEVRFVLQVDQLDDIGKVLQVAGPIVAASSRIDAEVRAYIVDQLLDSTNDELKAEGRAPLDGPGLLTHATLDTVILRADGSYNVIHTADALLGDHWIEVEGTLASGPSSLNTPG